MRLNFDYEGALVCQCECVVNEFNSLEGVNACGMRFSEICRKLNKDFLPPIDREDIASISYSLLECARAAKLYCTGADTNEAVFGDLSKQLKGLKPTVIALIGKKKACGDEIRRLMNINNECREKIFAQLNGKGYNSSIAKYLRAERLNCAVSDFLQAAQNAYYKNL